MWDLGRQHQGQRKGLGVIPQSRWGVDLRAGGMLGPEAGVLVGKLWF